MVLGQWRGGWQGGFLVSASFRTLKSCFMHISSLPKQRSPISKQGNCAWLLGNSQELLFCADSHTPLFNKSHSNYVIINNAKKLIHLLLGFRLWSLSCSVRRDGVFGRSEQQLHRGFDLHNPLPKLVIVTQSHCHRLWGTLTKWKFHFSYCSKTEEFRSHLPLFWSYLLMSTDQRRNWKVQPWEASGLVSREKQHLEHAKIHIR